MTMDFDIETLIEMLNNPEIAQQLSAMSVYSDRTAALKPDIARYEEMRNMPAAQGMRAGGTYVASSPLEHAAVALRRYQGERGIADTRRQQNALMDNDATTRTLLANAMANAMRRARSQQPQQPEQPEEERIPEWGGEYY